jgi:uncharacterized protein
VTLLAVIVMLLGLLVALAGVVLPVVPGVPVALVAAILAGWMTGFERLDANVLIWVAVLTAFAQAVDLLGTWAGSRYFGARRAGLVGGIVGALVGLVVLPPWGFLLGALFGAVGAELATGRRAGEAWRAGVGALLGTVTGVAGKLVIVIVIGVVTLSRLLGG